jgi:hypothetical protein
VSLGSQRQHLHQRQRLHLLQRQHLFRQTPHPHRVSGATLVAVGVGLTTIPSVSCTLQGVVAF